MVAILSSAAVLASFASIAAALPSSYTDNGLEKRGFSCSSVKQGLTKKDCEYMSKIGMAGQGDNVHGKNNHIWVGSDGPNKFIFTNKADPKVPITVILWDQPAGDYQSSFMNVRKPKISYSLEPGKSVTVSLANGVSGGWTALYNYKTILSQYGQIWNTWGEFTTGNYATFDISREIHMGGNKMDVKASTGCLANMDKCSYHCKSGDTCGNSGTYELKNCNPGSQPNAAGSFDGTNWHGGCQGWSNGGTLNANFY